MKIRIYSFLRRYFRHPWQLILGITGIALGVSVVLAIDLTNTSAERSFVLANQSVAGAITHQITAVDGYVDETLYADLRRRHGLRRLMPVVEGRIRTAAGQQYRLLGFDPVATFGLVHGQTLLSPADATMTLITEAGTAMISESLRDQLRVDIPARLEVAVNGVNHTLTIIGIMPGGNDTRSLALRSVFITDIGTAQTVLGIPGKLSRIDLVLDDAEAGRLAGLIDPSLQLLTAGARSHAMNQITRAFRTNLTALSLLALAIGAFLIYNTMTISILQRRELIATVRTLGMSRNELLLLILAESLLLAGAGLLAGYVLGTGLSQYLIRLASRTINDLYFVTEIQSVHLNAWSYAKAAALALGATMLAAYFPARDALAIAPELTRSRSRLERQTRARQQKYALAAALFAVGAAAVLLRSGNSIVAGFVALSFIIMSFAMLGPLLLVVIVSLARPVMTRSLGLTGTIASRGVLSSLSRTQVAVTVLAIAISATIGVSIMISSFRSSVLDWLDELLQADVYISAGDGEQSQGFDPALVARISSMPGIDRVATARWRDLWREDVPVQLLARDLDEQIFSSYVFLDGENNERWRNFLTTDSVIVSETYAYHNHAGAGDVIDLPTDQGLQPFTIIGVYKDYSSDRGIVSMHRRIYKKWWSDDRITSLSFYHEATLDTDDLVTELNQGILQQYNLTARPNRSLRELSMQIFDRTFVITGVLRVLTVVIAFIGILSALMAIQLERDREFAVLRAAGMTPWDLRRLMLSEGGLMGAAAGLIAIPLGITMAAVLIHVINRRSFGWGMDFILAPQYLLGAVILGLMAGILAGIYPAWRMSAVSPAQALHYE